MRRLLTFALILAALAAPAGAQQKARMAVPERPAAKAPAKPVEPPATIILPPPLPLSAARPAGDPMQCRASCARTLYFCRANDSDDGCSTQWSQCSARCVATYAAPSYAAPRI